MKKRTWVAAGSVGALGLSVLGAAAVAQASSLPVTGETAWQGEAVVISQGVVTEKFAVSSVATSVTAPPASAVTSPATPEVEPTPVPVTSAVSVTSAPSAVSAVSAQSAG